MPFAGPRACGCGRTVPAGQRCVCRAEHRKAHDQARGSAAGRGYDGNWRRESKAFLALPGNERCACGCGRVANMVDHIQAPKGDRALFWDRSNWQPFNVACNSRKAISSEGGFGRAPIVQTGGRVRTSEVGGVDRWGAQRRVAPNSVGGDFEP